MATDEHYYIGIDLGTTNCSIHWGVLNPNTNRVEPRSLAFDQLTSSGSMERRVLLPSYLWFRQGEDVPLVGDYARVRGLEAQPSRVARSVKNFMGRHDWRFEVDGNAYDPVSLTTYLLRHLFSGIQSVWGMLVSDVVITVPASFDSDMRSATLEAADRAGFKTQEADGSQRNLLLDEPRAALYDLLNQQMSGSFPRLILDLTAPKNVLVFDLGGGTLDVSLHRVAQANNELGLSVEDLAISRYTQLGGGVFDALVADELQRQFEARHKLSVADLPKSDQNLVRARLEVQAELVKQRLTNDIDRRLRQGTDGVTDDYSVDIQFPFLYDTKGLITRLTKREFEHLLAPLLGWELDLSLVGKFDTNQVAQDNIIYPILDVLHKASWRLGHVPVVDAVVLNGGMTRVHVVRDRIEKLFNLRPVTVLDPEMAVSRGAAVYHYLLHRGWRPSQILAESIGVEVEGNRIYQLVPAGTVLPFGRSFTDRFSVPTENAQWLTIPLYRGESKTPAPPNKKLLERRVRFAQPQAAGTPITVEVSIDQNKLVAFVAVTPDGSRTAFEVGAEDNAEKSSMSGSEGVATNSARPWPSGPAIQEGAFRRDFREASESWNEARLKSLSQFALGASNVQQLVAVLLDDLNLYRRPGKYRALWLLGEFAGRWPEDPLTPRIVSACIENLRKHLSYPSAINTVGRASVEALGKASSQIAESHLIKVLNDERVDSIRPAILMALGRCAATGNTVKHISSYVDSERTGERICSLWSLGKLGSRERQQAVPIQYFLEILPSIARRAVRKYDSHIDVRQYALYAIGEISDRRPLLGETDVIDDEHADYVLRVLDIVRKDLQSIHPADLKYVSQYEHMRRLADIAEKQVKGESLTEDEARILMSVRTLMGVTTGE
jgi:molecular chaperone DnaK (HSP70)